MMRQAVKERKTLETAVSVSIGLDGSGKADIATGVGFFDHMLTLLAKHGFLDLQVKAQGDLQVDCHHTVEDCGIVLGEALKAAVGDKSDGWGFGTGSTGFFRAAVPGF